MKARRWPLNRFARILTLGGIVAGGSWSWLACGSDGGSSGTQGGGDGGSQTVPAGCDLSKDPRQSPACVDDLVGLFVSTNGSDSAAGTKAAPLASIGAALLKLDSQHTRVYVCAGAYQESLQITGAAGVYGGFSCTDWSYAQTSAVTVKAPSRYALDIESVIAPVVIEDIELDAPSAKAPGDSSIAVFVAQSTNVSLIRVIAAASDGMDAAPVSSMSNYDPDVDGGVLAGNAAFDDTGPPAKNCLTACKNSVGSVGGKGGEANLGGDPGTPNIPPNPDAFHNGAGGTSASSVCGSGNYGSFAAPADGGAAGAASAGNLTSNGWTASSGSAGATGGPGQGGGGGGGGGVAGNKGGGGSGACGGCGGAGGAPGLTGGSSLAVLVYQSTLTLDSCTLSTGRGGAGGSGGSGQDGQPGGVGGAEVSGGLGCRGGNGGNGGPGAGGGGGAGGDSIAVAYVGTAPSTPRTTFTEGAAGAPGPGGHGGNLAGNDGLPGAGGTKADIAELR